MISPFLPTSNTSPLYWPMINIPWFSLQSISLAKKVIFLIHSLFSLIHRVWINGDQDFFSITKRKEGFGILVIRLLSPFSFNFANQLCHFIFNFFFMKMFMKSWNKIKFRPENTYGKKKWFIVIISLFHWIKYKFVFFLHIIIITSNVI